MQGLVLSGGGSKGAYQIGVWKALRKMHIKIDIVTGTSIGAINSVLVTQKDFYKGIRLWKNISYNQLFENNFEDNDTKRDIYLKYAKEFIKNGGMDTSKIEKFIDNALNLKKFYKSKIKFGLITYNLSKMQPEIKTKENILPSKLKEYVLASSTCFPAFKIKDIDSKKFIDGGYYDNLPINLAIELGAAHIIAVDLNCIGIKQKINNNEIPVMIIEPKNDLGSFLVFDKNQARKNIKYGYNDTLKMYNKLDGNKFTFKRDSLYKNYKKYNKKFIKTIRNIFEYDNDTKNIYDNLIKYSKINKLIDNKIDSRIIMNEIIEYLGNAYNFDDTKIYSIKHYNRLLKKYNKDYCVNDEIFINLKFNEQYGVINSKLLIKYIYNKLRIHNQNYKTRKELCRLASLFPNDFLGAIYLLTIN